MSDVNNNRNRLGSSFTLIEQDRAFGEKLKRQATATVRVVTDDAQYDNALLLRDDEKGIIRLGVCRRNGRARGDGHGFDHQQTWAVIGVLRSHIKSLTVVGHRQESSEAAGQA